jgi:predicted transcriptional regulator
MESTLASDPRMIPAKQEALESIRKLPDDADMEEIVYQLYVIDKIREGQEAVRQGQFTTSEELRREIEKW